MESSKSKSLIVIGGPTGVGKTNVAIALAQYLNCEIINADSRQVYQELSIGVNKPSQDQLNQAKHHLIGHVSIHDTYNAGRFELDALNIIDDLYSTNEKAILVGGTGLYIRAVLEGLDEFPTISQEIKSKVEDIYIRTGLEGLQKKVEVYDPEYFNKVDQKNSRRLSRALEVYYATGIPYSQSINKQIKERSFKSIPLFINDTRITVYNKIDQRVDDMILQGLQSEVEKLLPNRNLKSLETVGYKEWWDYFDGTVNQAHVIDKIKQHTRNYAKRQWTWWKPLQWPSFHPDQLQEMIEYINDSIDNKD